MNHISIVQAAKPVNKVYSLKDGQLTKTTAAGVFEGTVSAKSVDSHEHLTEILEVVTESADQCIVPGRWRGHDSGELSLMTEAGLRQAAGLDDSAEITGAIRHNGKLLGARLKASIEPSNWLLIDLDEPPGFPDAWRRTVAERLEMLGEATGLPFDRVTRIELRSSSNRVRHESEAPKQASHVWIRISDPSKIDLLRAAVGTLVKANGLSYPCERKGGAISHLTICDLAVFAVGRLTINARPEIQNSAEKAGYVLDPAGITIVRGELDELDISGLSRPTREVVAQAAKRTGVTSTISSSGASQVFGQLKLETPITSGGHTKPLSEWLDEMNSSGITKLRCEAPFRESSSEAAFIRISESGRPCVFDAGASETYRLEGEPGFWDQLEELKAGTAEERAFATIVANDPAPWPVGVNIAQVAELWCRSYSSPSFKDRFFEADQDGTLSARVRELIHVPTVFGQGVIDFEKLKQHEQKSVAFKVATPREQQKMLEQAPEKAESRLVNIFLKQLAYFRNCDQVIQGRDWRLPRDSAAVFSFEGKKLTIYTPTKRLREDFGIPAEIEDRVVADWLSHWPEFTVVLDFILAARVATSRREATLWLNAPAGSGKSLTFEDGGVLANLGLVASATQSQIQKAMSDEPSSLEPEAFLDAWVLFIDEVRTISQSVKELNERLKVAPKFRMAVHVPVYAKVLASADDILRSSSKGVDSQIGDRVSVMRPSVRLPLKRREVFLKPGEGYSRVAYRDALSQWVAKRLNSRMDELRSMPQSEAETWANDWLGEFIKQHSVEKTAGRFEDALPELAAEFLADCEELLCGRTMARGIVDALHGYLRIGEVASGGTARSVLVVQNSRRTIKKWLEAKEYFVHARNSQMLLDELGFDPSERPRVRPPSGYVDFTLEGYCLKKELRTEGVVIPIDLRKLGRGVAA